MAEILMENTPKLGFGFMRLPKLESGEIDLEQTKQMVDCFLQAGLTYFDTAFVYDGGKSERPLCLRESDEDVRARGNRRPHDTLRLRRG